MNHLYDIVHFYDKTCASKLEARVHSFYDIKDIADPVYQNLFRIEDNPDDTGIVFTVGATKIFQQALKTLSGEDQLFLNRYHADQANADETFSDRFLSGINGELQAREAETGTKQLFLDVHRGKYKFDGFDMSSGDGIETEVKKERLAAFLKKLAPAQQKTLNVVGSQLGPIALIEAVFYSNDSKFIFLGNPRQKTEYNLDTESGELEVHLRLQQNVANLECVEELLEAYNSAKDARYFPGLGLNVTFSIAKNGAVACSSFEFSCQTETALV